MTDYMFIKEALFPSYGMAFGLREVTGYQVLELSRAARFQDLDPPGRLTHEADAHTRDTKVIDRAGYRRRAPDGGLTYLFLPSVWSADIVAGLDARSINRTLTEQGVLMGDADGKASRLLKIDAHPTRVYVVRADRLVNQIEA